VRVKLELNRNPYHYRRKLPHITKADRAHFVTFHTWHWWVLPPESRTCVLSAFKYYHPARYDLLATVVMPEHAHAVIVPATDSSGNREPLSAIFQAIKSFTAHQIAKATKRKIPVWESESFCPAEQREA
jgi:hypothetical protein